MRRRLVLAAVLLAAPLMGCGTGYELPTERPRGAVPTDKSYGMIATWTNMTDVQDVLLTQGTGTQLFILFNHGGGGTGPDVPRGEVQLYPLSRSEPIGAPYFTPLATLFNPVAIASAQNKLFVLDQGDTCLARYNPAIDSCYSSIRNNPIRDLRAYWHVREFGLGGGDTLSTFTDTTVAFVNGMAAGEDGYVYLSGTVAVLDTQETDQRIRTRKFVSRIYRYQRGAGDTDMPGSNWHRDRTWVIEDGAGNSSVQDPANLYFSRFGGRSLYVADRGNSQVKALSVIQTNVGLLKVDGSTTGSNFLRPEDVYADLAGFFYVLDRGTRRVWRYDGTTGEYVQRVDLEPNAQGETLLDPVAIAADDSLAYVADRGRGKVIRYKRRG
ncbi:MAG: hypothetical protein ABIU54_08340 [Candidatus Eisenbacteria bacterium]